MIYEYFALRLHDATSWQVKTGSGILSEFVVGSVTIPAPDVKTEGVQIPGMSGMVDYTERPRPFFNNKPVDVTLSGYVSFEDRADVESTLSAYNGRTCDFTFTSAASRWFYTGRLTVSYNWHQNKVFLHFDCLPYKYKDAIIEKQLQSFRNYESNDNTASWDVLDPLGHILKSYESRGNFVYKVDKPEITFERRKSANSNTARHALGIVSIVGGDIWFEYIEDGNLVKSKTLAVAFSGTFVMKVHVDGSYYEWTTVNTERRYLPTIRCTYILTSDLDMTENTSFLFPSNVAVVPDAELLEANGYIVSDGVAIEVVETNFTGKIPRLILPGNRSNFSNLMTRSVFGFVPHNDGGYPNLTLRWREQEVF